MDFFSETSCWLIDICLGLYIPVTGRLTCVVGSFFQKLAAGSLTFAKAYSNGEAKSQIDNLEQELEAEIKRETKSVPDTKIAR